MPVRFQVDPDFYDHPKVLGMSDAAFALWVRAGSYSAAKTTDGFVPEDALSLFSQTQQEAAEELVRRGLWKRARGGYRFHQWELRNLTRARVDADREYERERKQRQRHKARLDEKSQVDATLVPAGQGRDNHRDSGRDSGRNPNRSVSLSVSTSESVSGSGRGPAATATHGREEPPPPTCPQHPPDYPDPPPCGKCADARRARNQWDADRAKQLRDAPKCRTHRGQPAHNCALCRSEQLAEGASRG